MGTPNLPNLTSQTVIANNNIETRFRTIKYFAEFFKQSFLTAETCKISALAKLLLNKVAYPAMLM